MRKKQTKFLDPKRIKLLMHTIDRQNTKKNYYLKRYYATEKKEYWDIITEKTVIIGMLKHELRKERGEI